MTAAEMMLEARGAGERGQSLASFSIAWHPWVRLLSHQEHLAVAAAWEEGERTRIARQEQQGRRRMISKSMAVAKLSNKWSDRDARDYRVLRYLVSEAVDMYTGAPVVVRTFGKSQNAIDQVKREAVADGWTVVEAHDNDDPRLVIS